jgi:hypothetical protein
LSLGVEGSTEPGLELDAAACLAAGQVEVETEQDWKLVVTLFPSSTLVKMESHGRNDRHS